MRMKIFKWMAMFAGIGLVLACVGGSGPGGTVKKFYQYIDAGDADKVISLLPRSAVGDADREKFKVGLQASVEALKAGGGIRKIEIVKEEITGNTAVVTAVITLGNGEASTDTTKLVREDGVWKIAPSK